MGNAWSERWKKGRDTQNHARSEGDVTAGVELTNANLRRYAPVMMLARVRQRNEYAAEETRCVGENRENTASKSHACQKIRRKNVVPARTPAGTGAVNHVAAAKKEKTKPVRRNVGIENGAFAAPLTIRERGVCCRCRCLYDAETLNRYCNATPLRAR